MPMPKWLLYHFQGISKYRIDSIKKEKDFITFHISPTESLEEDCCPHCQSKRISSHGWRERTVYGVPHWPNKVRIIVKYKRYRCARCGATFQQKIRFVHQGKSYTRRLQKYVIHRLKQMTTKDVALDTGLHESTIKDIHKQYLKRKYMQRKLKGVTHIAIDEFAVRKGHKYMTVVMDLDTGKALYVCKGKDGKALKGFFRRLKRNQITIAAIASDMSPAFINAVREFFPDAIHVYDRFHVGQLINKTITDIRQRLYKELPTGEQKKALKGSRYLLSKRQSNLDPSKGEPKRLEKALKNNADLYTAYYLKEELFEVWECDSYDEAEGSLLDLVLYMESTEINELHKLAKSLRNHATGILAFLDCGITTGRLEGLNNKIKTLKRRAYGYRDLEYFKYLILDL